MNWGHLYTLLWLRWRLSANHVRRHGALNLIILSIAFGVTLIGSVIGFFAALVVGIDFLPRASPAVMMFICDGWLLGFLVFWTIGVVTDLQRGDMLSLDKLLHLPTTLTEVFTFNYLSSVICLTTLTFVPPLVGLSIAAVVTRGPAALVLFPLIGAFVLMVSAVTYQFRGWLATLMTNKRRQRTVVVIVTFIFVLATQAPTLINLALRRQGRPPDAEGPLNPEQLRELSSGKRTLADLEQERQERRAARNQAVSDRAVRILEAVNLVLPIGWLACGARAASTGNPWPGLAGTMGMAGIALVCLRRSYRTTLRQFTGDQIGEMPRNVAEPAPLPIASSPPSTAAAANVMEWSLPFVGEPAAAIACATFRSLTRAPEVKLVLLSPLIMLLVFGAMLLPNLRADTGPSFMRSMMPLGVLGLAISGLAQLSQNLFAFDRSGFRAYVLSGVPRREILIGKNLAFAPLFCIPSVIVLTLVQIVAPAPVTHFASVLVAIPTVYLLLSLLGNFSSIVCPVCHAAGSLKPAHASGITMLLQFGFLLATTAVLSIAAVVPLALEWLVQSQGWLPSFLPLALIVAVAELAASILFYRTIVRQQGELLQSRECRILEIVIEKGE